MMMSSWCVIILTSAVVLLSVPCHASVLSSITCSDVHLQSLLPVSGCVTVTREQGYVVVKCEVDENYILHVSLVREIANVPDNRSNITFCTGLMGYKSTLGNKSWHAMFNPREVTGLVKADRHCWQENVHGSCILEVFIASSILSLPLVRHHPESDDFWDLKAPMFSESRHWFEGLSLSECNLKMSWLSSLENTSIAALSLYHCSFAPETLHIPRLPHLKQLSLIRSGLSDFHPDNFLAIPNLEEMVISMNSLMGIPKGISRLTKLKVLDISHNYKYDFLIPTEELEKLTKLEYLNLACNRAFSNFTMLEKIPYLPNLKILNLSMSEIRNLDVDVDPFNKFPALEELYLSRNKLSHWNPKLLIHRMLKVLDLSKNKLAEWPILKGCRIGFLTLSLNSLTYIENLGNHGTFVYYLDISLNNITEWQDRRIFSSQSAPSLLQKIILRDGTSHGKLKNVVASDTKQSDSSCSNCTQTSYNYKKWVNDVDLSGNNIHTVSKEMMDSMTVLHSVDLEGNLFDCTDCSVPDFVKWMEHDKKVRTANNLICVSPASELEEKVIEADAYVDLCSPKSSYTIVVAMGNFLGVCLLVFLMLIIGVYWYRFEISYTLHLFKIRNSIHQDQDQKYLYDAFICFSGKDRPWVWRTLVPTLENGPEKYRLCLHDRDFVLGSMIVENIVQSIEKSRRVIIVLSRHFIDSRWCQWELDMANHKSFEGSTSFIILIQLEVMDRQILPRHLRFLMDTRTYLEWPYKQKEEINTDIVFKRLRLAMGQSILQAKTENETLAIENPV